MKYLYRILRLFFCPHKWEEKDKIEHKRIYRSTWDSNEYERKNIIYVQKCKYCGNLKEHIL